MLWSVNTTLYSGRIRLHVSAKNDKPPSGLITLIQKVVYLTTVFQVSDLKLYRLKYT